MAATYDFIIVGGGAAGCLLAERLSQSAARPSVLLVEAGGPATGDYLHAPFHRYMGPAMRSDLDHGYVSEPVSALNNREIVYTRGKGLGGSTLVNFQVYLYGSGEDYNRWAELVGDDSWKWDQVHKMFKEIESFDFEGTKEYAHLANPDPSAHGKTGSLKVSLPTKLERDIVPTIEAMVEHGEKINLDMNSGNPVGIGLFPNSSSKDGRTTSASAHLLNAPSNLTVWVNAPVEALLFEGTKVVGIATKDGRKATSTKEVVLSCGSIDTPKLLLLNGIGPAKELEPLGIKVIKNLPGVGKHLQDHVMSFLCAEVDGKSNDRILFEGNEKKIADALALWNKDKSGDFALYHNVLWGGFLKIPELEEYEEYQALDKSAREFLSKDSVPAYEFINNSLMFLPPETITPGSSYMTAIAFLMNPQSEGSVTLRSANPEDKPIIDLDFMSHPYDRRVFREGVRQTWTKVFENPTIKKDFRKRLYGPESLSDADIDAFIKESATTVWHANGTAMMGRPENKGTVVDTRFKVVGIQGLRVADLSVCPLTTNNHSQATAYLIGQKAADTLITDYQLAFSSDSKL